MSERAFRSGVTAIIATVATAILMGIITMNIWARTPSGPYMHYNSVDYQVEMLDNGDAHIVQTIDYHLDDKYSNWRQLYQVFTLDSDQVTTITDITVTNLTTGMQYDQIEPAPLTLGSISDTKWDAKWSNRWYIVDVTNPYGNRESFNPTVDSLTATGADEPVTHKDIEIGVNIPCTQEADSLTIQIEMTWRGVATAHQDVVEFEWEPLGPDNEIPANRVTGRVQFPDDVTELTSWAWLHTGAFSLTTRGDGGSLEFEISDMPAYEYMNLVAMYETDTAPLVRHQRDDAVQYDILAQEEKESEQWEDRARASALQKLLIWLLLAILCIGSAITAVLCAMRASHRAHNEKNTEYYRDIPTISVAAAAACIDIFHPVSQSREELENRQLAASLLALAEQHIIRILPGEASLYQHVDLSITDAAFITTLLDAHPHATDTYTIALLPEAYQSRSKLRIPASEYALLNCLRQISQRVHSPVFDFSMMESTVQNDSEALQRMRKFTAVCRAEVNQLNLMEPVGLSARIAGGVGIVSALVSAFVLLLIYHEIALGICIVLPTMFASVFAIKYAPQYMLTSSARTLGNQLRGLERYMHDFSDLSDRSALDVTLWGQYMVYATAFGMSEQFLNQMEQAYPQCRDMQWLNQFASAHDAVYWSVHHQQYESSQAVQHDASDSSAKTDEIRTYDSLGSYIAASFRSVRATIYTATSHRSSSYGWSDESHSSSDYRSSDSGSFQHGGFKGHSGGAGRGRGGGR